MADLQSELVTLREEITALEGQQTTLREQITAYKEKEDSLKTTAGDRELGSNYMELDNIDASITLSLIHI